LYNPGDVSNPHSTLPVPVSEPAPEASASARWPLIWAVAMFQLKLVVDGLKDIALFPLSLAAAAIDLIAGNRPERGLFAMVLRAGRGFDEWVDLFAAADSKNQAVAGPRGLDAHVHQLEQFVSDASKRKDLTDRARQAMDDALLALQRARQASPPEVRTPE